MRRSTVLAAAFAWAVGLWTALALPAASQILIIAHHGAAPGRPAGLAEHDRFGQPQPPAGVLSGSAPDQPGTSAVGRYVVESTITFTLDTSGPQPLLRFSNSSEVWALRPQPAPLGDTVYVNDAGETMLRANRLGGLTAFMPDQPQGVAAAFVGSAQPIIALPDIRSGLQFASRMQRSSAQLSHIAGHSVEVEAGYDPADPELGPENLPLVADAVSVTVDAFSKAALPQNAKRRTLISSIDKVHIKKGVPPDAFVKDDQLVVTITPGRGIAGRPSSQRILKVLLH